MGRGRDLALESCALDKLLPRLDKVRSLPAGTPMNRVLLRSVVVSCATHVLRCVTPMSEFEKLWAELQDVIEASPRTGLKPFVSILGLSLGFLASFRTFSVLDRLLTRVLMSISGAFWGPVARLAMWFNDSECLLTHPLEGRVQLGCLTTWRSAWH